MRYGPLVAVAENIRSLHNVGSIFRTCDGAGVSRLFLCGYTGFPPRPEIQKVALGAEEAVAWEHVWHLAPLLAELKQAGYQVVALERERDSDGVELSAFKPRWPLALLVGNEVAGLTAAARRAAEARVSIPMRGAKASLNVAVAFGVAVYRLMEHRP